MFDFVSHRDGNIKRRDQAGIDDVIQHRQITPVGSEKWWRVAKD
jgi:hypothetical protein